MFNVRKQIRNTTQFLMPYRKSGEIGSGYNIYPTLKLDDNLISVDLKSLAKKISTQNTVIVDGNTGVFFECFRGQFSKELEELGKNVSWTNVNEALKSKEEINQLISPFMGDDDSIFGTRATISLADYFDVEKLNSLQQNPDADLNILYGIGAQLAEWKGLLIYIDLPKNEIQFRARAKSVKNIGASQSFDMVQMYKRYYFVDWIVLNKHKKKIQEKIEIIIDGQQEKVFPWMEAHQLKKALKRMGENFFRVRPWFEPGVWGGNWIKQHIRGVNADAENYAWSFELITPENGIVFESAGYLLEVSFDFLMFREGKSVLGVDYSQYGDEFPIRFDFLDTFDGGSLSVQCHPNKKYCKENFGENITQEETYYIIDNKDNSQVYLGFQENIKSEKFEKALLTSFRKNKEIDVNEYILSHPSQKHDLFLIPPGTIHSSGINNLVLEISTTPYIFTFKLYDWVRPDLNGRPRPLNINHGMKNLRFDRHGEKVKEELISKPVLLEKGYDWQLYDLPTHKEHSYQIKRYHFLSEIKVETEGKFHVLSLVEGLSVTVTSKRGYQQTFSYVETFVVPAAAKSYTLKNNAEKEAVVVIAFMK